MPDTGPITKQVRWLVRLTFALFAILALAGVGAIVYIDHAQRATARSVAADRELLRQNRHTLSELCRQTNVVIGVVAEIDSLVQLRSAEGSADVQAARQAALGTLRGYLAALKERPSCGAILRP